MTYRNDFTLPAELLEQVQEQGLEVLPELIRIVLNAAMQAERSEHLQAAPYQHSEDRRGYANGYKPKTMRTRVGEITFAVPQVREGGFYPQALEKGLRSERALTLALAEMYVQGVSTRKVKAITEQLCGVSISSSTVSQAAAQLDGELEKWRDGTKDHPCDRGRDAQAGRTGNLPRTRLQAQPGRNCQGVDRYMAGRAFVCVEAVLGVV